MSTILSTDRFRLVEKQLVGAVGRANVQAGPVALAMYSYDSSLGRARPEGVVHITDWRKIAPVVKILYDAQVPFAVRAGATSLSGGCVPLKGGVVLNLAPLTSIIEINTEKYYALVEPGVVNAHLQKKLAESGYFYAPDPASNKVCTIGGNVGTNAGGPRCLKYGVTVNHIAAMDVVTPQGELVHYEADGPGPDFTALMTGAEGTLGVVARLWLHITELRPAVKTVLASFGSLDGAIGAVSAMVAAGVVPCAIEAMDRLTVSAVEAYVHAGYPLDAEAVLVIELDGKPHEVENEVKKAEAVCRQFDLQHWTVAQDDAQRQKIWEGRRGAFAAMARLAPNVAVEDGVVPRPKLPEVLKEVRDITARHNIRAGLLFHAGDGNLHPNIIFDERNQFETNRVKKAGHEILKACVRAGGSVTGEHGVGLDKRVGMTWLYDRDTLDTFRLIKDAFDPANIANPDKIMPVDGADDALIRPPLPELSPAAKKLADIVKMRAGMNSPSFITGSGSATSDKTIRGHRGAPLSIKSADAVLDWDRANYTITVEAGITMAALAQLLAKEHMYLFAPPMPGTLGGALASRRWHGLRDLLIGARVLLPDGRIASVGGKVVKNAAGYDFSRFLIGSQGAFGIILAATLKLSPKPFEGERRLPPFAFFTPDSRHRRLKDALDPHNLFNSWIFGASHD